MLTTREFVSLASTTVGPPWKLVDVPPVLWKGSPRSLRSTIQSFEDLRVAFIFELRPVVLPLTEGSLDSLKRNFQASSSSKGAVEALAKAIEPFGGSIVWLSEGYRKATIRGPYISLVNLPILEIDDRIFSALRSGGSGIHILDQQSDGFQNIAGSLAIIGGTLMTIAAVPEPFSPELFIVGAGLEGIAAGIKLGQGLFDVTQTPPGTPSTATPGPTSSATPQMIESPDGSGQETAVFGDDSGFDPQLIAALDEIVIESLPIDPSQFIPGDPLGGGLTPGQTLPRDPGVDSGDGTGIPPGIF